MKNTTLILLFVCAWASAANAYVVCKGPNCAGKIGERTAPAAPAPTPSPNTSNLTLTFADEFNGSTLDLSRWTLDYVNSNATLNDELQAYTPFAFEQASNGALRIKAEKQNFAGKAYTSGALTSYGTFSQTYGYFEMRAKVPAGRGLWPAFWMLNDRMYWPPEIDMLEYLGHDTKAVYTSVHWLDAKNVHQMASLRSVLQTDLSQDYHVYALSWRPNLMIWYVDNVDVYRYAGDGVPNEAMYLILNMAVGGNGPGAPDTATVFPAYYDIDYVRAYQYRDVPAVTPQRISFGKGETDKLVYQPGETVHFTTTIKVGDVGGAASNFRIQMCDYYETTCYNNIETPMADFTPHEVRRVNASFLVPTPAGSSGVFPIRAEITIGGVHYSVEDEGNIVLGGASASGLAGGVSTGGSSSSSSSSSGGSTSSSGGGAAVNGACGSTHGTTLSAAPASNFCTTGTPFSLTGDGPWTWRCAGSSGGTTANCSAAWDPYVPLDPTLLNYTMQGRNWAIQTAKKAWSIARYEAADTWRFTVKPGDQWSGDLANNSAKERAEFADLWRQPRDTTYWVAFSSYYDGDTWPYPQRATILGQLHDVGSTNPIISLELGPTNGFRVKTASAKDDGTKGTTVQSTWFQDKTPAKKRWYNYVIKYKVNYLHGSLEVWRDGKKVVNRPDIPVGYNVTGGPYWKFGYYSFNDVASTRTVYYSHMTGPTVTDLSSIITNPPPVPTIP